MPERTIRLVLAGLVALATLALFWAALSLWPPTGRVWSSGLWILGLSAVPTAAAGAWAGERIHRQAARSGGAVRPWTGAFWGAVATVLAYLGTAVLLSLVAAAEGKSFTDVLGGAGIVFFWGFFLLVPALPLGALAGVLVARLLGRDGVAAHR